MVVKIPQNNGQDNKGMSYGIAKRLNQMIELKKMTKGNTSLSNRCRNDRNTTNNYVKGNHDMISQISPNSHDEKRGELRTIHHSKNLLQLYTSNAHYGCF